ncbi:hypothetical protein GGP59_003429 [Salinibacter ruber]|nr:hypothetical protein [Salinibacter ruber]
MHGGAVGCSVSDEAAAGVGAVAAERIAPPLSEFWGGQIFGDTDLPLGAAVTMPEILAS